MKQKQLDQYLMNPTLRKEIEDAVDRLDWIEQVIESCETADQLDAAYKLFNLCDSVNKSVMYTDIVQDKHNDVTSFLKKKQSEIQLN